MALLFKKMPGFSPGQLSAVYTLKNTLVLFEMSLSKSAGQCRLGDNHSHDLSPVRLLFCFPCCFVYIDEGLPDFVYNIFLG
jgi:hypothetical protein